MTEPSGHSRVVEPYMLFISGAGKHLFHLFQVGGYSASGIARGWKSAGVGTFQGAEILDRRFTPRAEYNPANTEAFPTIVYAVRGRFDRPRVAGKPW